MFGLDGYFCVVWFVELELFVVGKIEDWFGDLCFCGGYVCQCGG